MFSRRDTLKISLALSAMGLSAAPAFAWKTGEPEEKISCDILVIGSGIAGTVAALQAVEDGANVLMIDKASESQRGGNSKVCLGSFLMRTVFAMVRTPILTGANSSLNTVRNAASN